MGVNAWSIFDNLAVFNTASTQLQAMSVADKILGPVTASIHEINALHLVAVHVVFDACVVAIVVARGRR